MDSEGSRGFKSPSLQRAILDVAYSLANWTKLRIWLAYSFSKCTEAQLERAITRFMEGWNENPRPFVWTKTAQQIRRSIRNAKLISET